MTQIVCTADPACGANERTLAFWCDALDRQAAEFCEKWGVPQVAVSYYSTDILQKLEGDALAKFVADSWLLTLQTSLDTPNALGFHDDLAGVIFARVLWQGDATSITMSHEILEMLGDPTCDVYIDLGNGKEQAKEAADRVEGDSYIETGAIGEDSVPVSVSNYLLPSAFVPASSGPWDRMGRLTAWNGMTDGGYMIVRNPDGSEVEVFADTVKGEANADAKRKKVGGRAWRRLK